MSDRPTQHAELLQLCGKVRDDTLTPEDAMRLDALLQTSDEIKALYVQYMSLVSLLESRGAGQHSTNKSDMPVDAIDPEIFAELLRMERRAEVTLTNADKLGNDDAQANKDDEDPNALSAHDLAAVGGYALRLALSSGPAKRIYAYAGVAAAVLLAFVLFNPFGGNEDATDAPFATDHPNDSIKPGPVGPAQSTAVATLTATHDAEWASQPGGDVRPGALRPGTQLTVGQRLTLTQGVAEITTARGAVAILEAPATIELLNNDNAMHLHAGKLVGSCYSESSKGFVVKTDHADIIDIGTEFGVEVRDNNVTATVMTGEIEMDVPGSAPQRLTQDQTAQLRVNGVNRKLQIKDQLAQGFEQLLPRRRLAEALRNDPAMIAYYGFEAEDIVDGKLLNRAAATQGRMDGTLGQPGKPDSSPTLTDGRVPGTGALRFEAQEFDLVRVPAEDAAALNGLEQFTIGLWVKPDHMDQASHHLVTKRVGDKCVLNLAMVWNAHQRFKPNSLLFNSDLGGMVFEEHATEKDTLVRSGAWTHIAVTFDRGERRYYVNGELIGTKPRAGADKTLTLDAELAIGAQYANALAQATNLDGDLDELFILGRVMPRDEITTLYETGVAQP